MNKVEFGIWVRQERERQDMSQADLARRSGLYRSIINNIENGVSQPSPQTLIALANGIGHDAEFLFELVNLLPPKTDLSPIKRMLMHLAKDLPDSDIETIVAQAEQRTEYYRKNPQAKPSK